MKLFLLVGAILIALLSASCETPTEYIEITGTVRRIHLEGGFWGITVEDGRKFDPVNMPERFKKDGLKVFVKMRPRDELAGAHMWGHMVEIVEIREAEF
ncbi:MAG: hypothetical protein ACE5JK_05105 [Candidatus Omnitrophota bacterium]